MIKTTLYYKDGSSDKVYSCEIVEVKGGFVVNFAYGRRGSTMVTGTKTPEPIEDRVAAVIIYTKLIREKTAKGYTLGEDGQPYTAPEPKEQAKYNVQLLNFIEEADVQRLINDDAYCAQEKFDGERMTLRKSGGKIAAGNKLGLLRGYPECFDTSILISDGKTFDGEIVGEVYHAFDVLEHEGKDIRSHIYLDRIGRLPSNGGQENNCFRPVYTAFTTKDKQALYDKLKKEGKEGIVFKLLNAPYVAGRPASGGNQLKFKFYATASCKVVGPTKGKRSVSLGVLDGEDWINVGNVTIPPNKTIPVVSQLVEVRYLYAYKGGSLFQPTYLGPRIDILENECVISQLKYKSEDK